MFKSKKKNLKAIQRAVLLCAPPSVSVFPGNLFAA